MTLEIRICEAFAQALPTATISDLLNEVFAAETARKVTTDAEFAAERMTVATVEVRKLLEETQWAERAPRPKLRLGVRPLPRNLRSGRAAHSLQRE